MNTENFFVEPLAKNRNLPDSPNPNLRRSDWKAHYAWVFGILPSMAIGLGEPDIGYLKG